MKRKFQLAFWWLVAQLCGALLSLTEPAAGEPEPSIPAVRVAAARCGCAWCTAEVVYQRGPIAPREALLMVMGSHGSPEARA